ncbi:MAG: hypothetical protein ACR2KF_08550 [Nitrososphaeraceae archaeon]
MPKFTHGERSIVKSIVATLSIAKVSEQDIIQEIRRSTGKTVSKRSIYALRESIKKDSYLWYQTLRQGHYEFIHEFKERINEIVWLQQKHHKIIADNATSPTVMQASLAELHRLNITLSNYFDVAPHIIANLGGNNAANKDNNSNQYDNTISTSKQDKKDNIIV